MKTSSHRKMIPLLITLSILTFVMAAITFYFGLKTRLDKGRPQQRATVSSPMNQ